jgi:hypothetical protein
MILTDGENIFEYEGHTIITISRFFCAIILHLALMDELRLGLNLMKYILNHSHEFQDWGSAFAVCVYKIVAVFVTELLCIFVVTISIAPMAIVYNFIALGILADFDDYIF